MEMVKLVKGDRTIERPKVDYENNIKIWGIRGWKLDDGKPKAEPKPEPKVDSEWKKPEQPKKPKSKKVE
tara:strand:+ start:1338 stop:1544 length:207 start_codon:yes stop_codon:yes gene_type:complete